MPVNIEIKARIHCWDEVHTRAQDLAPGCELTLDQCDTYFTVPHGRLKLRRTSGQYPELIYYNRENSEGPQLSHYTRIPVPDAGLLESVLQYIMGIRAVVRKQRTLFLVGTTRIHLDRVARLGDFVELEVVLPHKSDENSGRRIARSLMDCLHIPDDQLVAESYLDLLEKEAEEVADSSLPDAFGRSSLSQRVQNSARFVLRCLTRSTRSRRVSGEHSAGGGDTHEAASPRPEVHIQGR